MSVFIYVYKVRNSSGNYVFRFDKRGEKIKHFNNLHDAIRHSYPFSKDTRTLDEILNSLENVVLGPEVISSIEGKECPLCNKFIKGRYQEHLEKCKGFSCQCGKVFVSKKNLDRHWKGTCELNENKDIFTCKCGKKFNLESNMNRHWKNYCLENKDCPIKFRE